MRSEKRRARQSSVIGLVLAELGLSLGENRLDPVVGDELIGYSSGFDLSEALMGDYLRVKLSDHIKSGKHDIRE
jgi:hypothetical protein